jgi:hypothetical protein
MREYAVLGKGEFLGFKVEVWEAPELGCRPLYYKMEVKNDQGTVTKGAEEVATSVVLGEPTESFFAIPTRYEERSFSEAMNVGLLKRGDGEILPEDTRQKLIRLDKAYYESRAFARK